MLFGVPVVNFSIDLRPIGAGKPGAARKNPRRREGSNEKRESLRFPRLGNGWWDFLCIRLVLFYLVRKTRITLRCCLSTCLFFFFVKYNGVARHRFLINNGRTISVTYKQWIGWIQKNFQIMIKDNSWKYI